MRTSVFFTSELYTSLPTMGQNGTLLPNSCAIPSASAVLPVPGAPRHQKSASSHLLLANHVHHDTARLARVFLPDPSRRRLRRVSVILQTQTLHHERTHRARARPRQSFARCHPSPIATLESRTRRIESNPIETINQSQSDESFIRSLRAPFVSRASHLDVRVRGDARLARQARHLVDLHPIDRLARLPLGR